METTVKGAAATVAAVLLLALVLYYAYRDVISPLFSYQGLRYRAPDASGVATSLAIASVAALTLPRAIRRPSDLVLWVVFIVAALPAILVSQYAPILTRQESTTLGLNVAGAMILARVVAAAGPTGFFPDLRNSIGRHIWLILGAVSVVIYAVLVAFVGVQLRYLSFADVYDVRAQYVQASLGVPLIGYALPVLYNVVNPIFMVRGLYARRLGPLVLGAAGQVIVYMTTGQKSVLLSTVALAGFAFLFRGDRALTGARILAATALGSLATLVVGWVTGSSILTSLFVRRFVVVSGALSAAYVAVLRGMPRTNFADSVLPFLHNPYDGGPGPTFIVGSVFVGNADTNANVSLFGHGYLSFGYPGMYIEALVLALMLWLVDDASSGLPVPVASLVFLMPSIAIASASIFTAILTHGLLAGTVLAAALPRDGWQRTRRREPGRPRATTRVAA